MATHSTRPLVHGWIPAPEGMAVARAKGKLRGKKPKLSARQARELRRMHDTEDYSVSDLAEVLICPLPQTTRTKADLLIQGQFSIQKSPSWELNRFNKSRKSLALES